MKLCFRMRTLLNPNEKRDRVSSVDSGAPSSDLYNKISLLHPEDVMPPLSRRGAL